jgi:membrane protein DedA with SNARE-associated domain
VLRPRGWLLREPAAQMAVARRVEVRRVLGGLTIWIMHLPAAGVYAFIFAWLFVESTGFPISDEPLLLLAGYLSQRHRLDLPLAISVALVGKVLASSLAYAVGRYVDLLWLARPDGPVPPGRWSWLMALRPTRATLLGAEARFRRQGVWAVFLGRLVPVVRSFISYPAGAARMPFGIFLAATSAGSLLWITTWTLLGEALGRSYEAAAARWGTLSWLVLAVFAAAVGLVWLWSHRHVRSTTTDSPMTSSKPER